jgi:hypothetical protein
MREQKAHIPLRPPQRTTQAYEEFEYRDRAGRVIETERVPVHPHRAGHYAGLHPEDQPYMTHPQVPQVSEDGYDEPPRQRSSAIRYTMPQGQRVIQQGNRRLIIHEDEAPPPKKQRTHWALILGLGMVLMLLVFFGFSLLMAWWTDHQLDSTYGFPRTYQTDQVVGHQDSTDHPSHFIFLNLNGHVLIIELPAGDSSHAKMYQGPTLITDNASSVPVTGEFKDVNGDGKIDMIVHIGDQRIIYLNDGTQFKLQQ